MSYEYAPAPRMARPTPVSRHLGWTVRDTAPRPIAHAHLTRRFELSWIDAGGEIHDVTRIAPALPAFEAACAGFAHGTQIQTANGLVSVEDLLPGDMLTTAGGGETRLLWKGSITLIPGAKTMRERPERLYRVAAEAFGFARPSADILLGPDARVLTRDALIRHAVRAEAALVPVASLVDGVSVIEVTPVAPIRVYHLVTERHETVLAGGMEVETYRPDPEVRSSLSHEMMATYLSLFPTFESLADFGRERWPRLNEEMMEALAH